MNPLEQVSHFVFSLFTVYPIQTVFVLITLEEAGLPLPVPGDTLLVLVGAHRHHSLLFDAAIILAASIAVFLGSTVLFFLMQRGGRQVLVKYGKFLHVSEKRLDQVEQWFVRRGQFAVILGRLIPGLRIPTTMVAGLSGMSYRSYAVAAAIAALLWATIYFFLGVLVGKSYSLFIARLTNFLDTIPRAVLVIGALILLAATIGGVLHIRQRLRDRAARKAAS